MDRVDRGDQHRTIGVSLTNVTNFQKWYKRDFLGISDFSLLQAFTACNMSVDAFRDIGRGGVTRRNYMVKLAFYSAMDEYLLAYIDDDETNTHSADIPTTGTSHKALAVTRAFGKRYPACGVCSV